MGAWCPSNLFTKHLSGKLEALGGLLFLYSWEMGRQIANPSSFSTSLSYCQRLPQTRFRLDNALGPASSFKLASRILKGFVCKWGASMAATLELGCIHGSNFAKTLEMGCIHGSNFAKTIELGCIHGSNCPQPTRSQVSIYPLM